MIDNLINWQVIFSNNDSEVSELELYPLYDVDGVVIHHLSNNPLLVGMTFDYRKNTMLGITNHIVVRIS